MPKLNMYRMAIPSSLCVTVHAVDEKDALDQAKRVAKELYDMDVPAQISDIDPEDEKIRQKEIDGCFYVSIDQVRNITVENNEGPVKECR